MFLKIRIFRYILMPDIFRCQIYSDAKYIWCSCFCSCSSQRHRHSTSYLSKLYITHKPRTLFPSQTNPSPYHWTSKDFFLKQNMSQSLSHKGNVLKPFAVFFVWRSGPLEKLHTTEAKNQDSSILLDHFLIFDIWLVFMPSHSSLHIDLHPPVWRSRYESIFFTKPHFEQQPYRNSFKKVNLKMP